MSAINPIPAARAAGKAPPKKRGAPWIIQELARSINRSPVPGKVFYAVLHYIAATAAVPDAEKATIFRRLASEWDRLAERAQAGTD
ncbi:hypothetical protein [Klebsiella michiganensis]|uniref:hypothetical protein n=1 Tax=Klebsiella michiganensis TaxID=1134687 RepID=UPI002247BFC5|nr:hypothetical protein [Klebsiella michiganensis]MCW9447858.1 hypothetical protein [Klebsiella michiganensis]